MLRSYNLLENVLIEIEKGIREDINADILTKEYSLSERHLRRLFKSSYKQSIAGYVRSRKLAASLDELINTDSNILDIALNHGFSYEQSYINAFKREFGITPGELRKSGQIVKITPPLHFFDESRLPNDSLFGPEIVVVPQFHVVGRRYKVPHRDAITLPGSLAKQFHLYERPNIPNAVNPNTPIDICTEAEKGADYFYFMPAAMVKTLDNIPKGYDSYTFPASLCARFCFTNYTLDNLNMHIAGGMYRAINDFMDSEDQQYFLERKRININKLNLADKYGNYLQLEWFAPVIEKKSLKFPPFSPSGIKKVYKQELPALRFIGKKCVEQPEPKNILNLLDNWQLKGWFNEIEKQSNVDYKTFFESGDAYISLVRKKDGSFKEDGVFEHWMGMFMPEGTEAPLGYEAIDFPKMTIGVSCVYGKRDETVNYETECWNRLTEEYFTLKNARWFFRRFNWRGFYNEDVYGKCLLDYCYETADF